MKTRPYLCFGMLALVAGAGWAKLPPPSEEAKAKAAEAAAKLVHADKVGSYKLCLVQDRLAAQYRSTLTAASAPVATPPCTDPGLFVYTPPPPPGSPASAAAPAPTPAATRSANTAAQPPLEAAGAHSPPKTAVAPPNARTPAADLPPKR